MLFYFTGTGNSYDAAKQLAGEDKLINIADCVKEKTFSFEIGEDETVALVFPVYYGGLPSIVKYFISKLDLNRKPSYMYTVLTCGGDGMGAEDMLIGDLEKHGFEPDAVFTVVMPDNYILMYEPATDEERAEALKSSKVALAEIKERVEAREQVEPSVSIKGKIMTAVSYPLYVHGRKTKKFWVDENCSGCGLCEKRCPIGAIQMVDGKPVWVKERCVQCLACIRCEHVQYGKKTADRKRYTNPEW